MAAAIAAPRGAGGGQRGAPAPSCSGKASGLVGGTARTREFRRRRKAEFWRVGIIQDQAFLKVGVQLGPGAPAAPVHSLALQFIGCWLPPAPAPSFLLSWPRSLPRASLGKWWREGTWQQNFPPSVLPSVPPPPLHPKSTGSASLRDLGVGFRQRGLEKLIPAVSWWGRGRPQARRLAGGKEWVGKRLG